MWCKDCRQWFKKAEGCPDCGYHGEGFNKWLRTAQLNAHLYSAANRVTKEKTDQAHFVREARKEQKRVLGT